MAKAQAVLVLTLALAACAPVVRSDGWKRAEKLCSANNGVRAVLLSPIRYQMMVVCNNDARFHDVCTLDEGDARC